MLESKHTEANASKRAEGGEIFKTKVIDVSGRVDFSSKSSENYLPKGTLLLFDRSIQYVTKGGAVDSHLRKATIMGEGIMRLPDGKEISVHDLISNQKAKVILSSDIVKEDLERHRIVELPSDTVNEDLRQDGIVEL
ncbi:MAG: hypothetical protein AAB790_03195 [Patescibacteria group bacterium]